MCQVSFALPTYTTYYLQIHRKEPPVSKLPIHGDGEQQVLFDSLESMRRQARSGEEPKTKLTAYFDFMANYGEEAEDIHYADMHM